MGMVLREGFSIVLVHLSQLVVEKWLRMLDTTRTQLLWMMRELVRAGAVGVDNVCYNLMRQAAGGDLSHRNIILIDYMLDIFIENRYQDSLASFNNIDYLDMVSQKPLLSTFCGQKTIFITRRGLN